MYWFTSFPNIILILVYPIHFLNFNSYRSLGENTNISIKKTQMLSHTQSEHCACIQCKDKLITYNKIRVLSVPRKVKFLHVLTFHEKPKTSLSQFLSVCLPVVNTRGRVFICFSRKKCSYFIGILYENFLFLTLETFIISI